MPTDKPNLLHADHRERVRARFEAEGLDHFADHNVLEMILFFSIPRRDTNEIAHRLLHRFGSLSAVFEASEEDLCAVEGVGSHTAFFLRTYPAVAQRYFRDRFSMRKSDWSYNELGKQFVLLFAGKNVEEVAAVFLDNSLSICAERIIHEGDVNGVGFSMRKVAEECLKYNASFLILAHNHPHGQPYASPDDYRTTGLLRDFLLQMGVTLIDHFIVAEGEFSSLGRAYFDQYLKEREKRKKRKTDNSDTVFAPFSVEDPYR